MSDKYQVYKSNKDSQWYFRRVAPNNEIVAMSEGYKLRVSALTEAQREANPEGLIVEIIGDNE